MNRRKLLAKALAGSKNIRFAEAQALAEGFGFTIAQISGNHHIFSHSGIPELVNLQDVDGMAKLYQIKQSLRLVER